jgi:hypothetical protein
MAPIRTTGAAPAAAPAPIPVTYRAAPYSYYAARPPFPAREYVGFGSNDFPFYGNPYGRPYDLWTWPYMLSDPLAPLAHYYYAPVR